MTNREYERWLESQRKSPVTEGLYLIMLFGMMAYIVLVAATSALSML